MPSLGAARVCWIAGRPAAGKTTLARRTCEALLARGRRCVVLDSDEARRAITPAPRYTESERLIFYRALAFAAGAVAASGSAAVVAATAGTTALVEAVRQACPGVFFVYARCPPRVAEARDPKGLYAAARKDPGSRLPGAGVPYEAPPAPHFVVDTGSKVSDEVVDELVRAFLGERRDAPQGSR
ncbi:MAG TPA: adenylyl-sulfate kinase [Vulgatibacter sp.]